MARASSTGLRILVGAGSFADASAALRIIEGFPDVIRASLGGVFIEEPHTLDTGRFPNRRLITKSGMTVLAPELAKIKTILRAEARAFQRSLDLARGAGPDDGTFSRRQGDLIGTAMRAAEGWDVLVIGCQPLHSVRGSIVLLGGGGAISDEMHSASESLSRRFSTDLITFQVGLARSDAMPSAARKRLSFKTLDAALSALARTNALAVLLDLAEGPVRTHAELSQVLEAARCPLVVIGASRNAATLEHSTQIPAAPSQEGQADDA